MGLYDIRGEMICLDISATKCNNGFCSELYIEILFKLRTTPLIFEIGPAKVKTAWKKKIVLITKVPNIKK